MPYLALLLNYVVEVIPVHAWTDTVECPGAVYYINVINIVCANCLLGFFVNDNPMKA